MMNYLSSAEISYNELSRTVKVGDREVAEWDGVFEIEGQGVYFLECKHTVTTVQNPHTPCANLALGYFGTPNGKSEEEYGGFGEEDQCWEMFSCW
jgi:hypothetical protein